MSIELLGFHPMWYGNDRSGTLNTVAGNRNERETGSALRGWTRLGKKGRMRKNSKYLGEKLLVAIEKYGTKHRRCPWQSVNSCQNCATDCRTLPLQTSLSLIVVRFISSWAFLMSFKLSFSDVILYRKHSRILPFFMRFCLMQSTFYINETVSISSSRSS